MSRPRAVSRLDALIRRHQRRSHRRFRMNLACERAKLRGHRVRPLHRRHVTRDLPYGQEPGERGSPFFGLFSNTVVTSPDHPSDHLRQQRIGQVGRGSRCCCGLRSMAAGEFVHSEAGKGCGLALRTAGSGKIGSAARAHIRLAQTRSARQTALQQSHTLHHWSR